jgi:hypothetical protein
MYTKRERSLYITIPLRRKKCCFLIFQQNSSKLRRALRPLPLSNYRVRSYLMVKAFFSCLFRPIISSFKGSWWREIGGFLGISLGPWRSMSNSIFVLNMLFNIEKRISFPLSPAKWIGNKFDKKWCEANKTFLRIIMHQLLCAPNVRSVKRAAVWTKNKTPQFQNCLIICAANSIRIAINAGNFDASLHHCLHCIACCQSIRLLIWVQRVETEIRF